MASFAATGRSSSLCLLLLLACSSLQAHARESQFFSKATRYDTATTETIPAKEEQLPTAKKEEAVQYTTDTGNGYGLYGRGPEKLPPADATVIPSSTTYSYNNAGEKFNTESFPSDFSNNEFAGTTASYGNKESNGAGVYPDGGSYNKYNQEANARYPNNANEREQFGMSDTRFLENGRYFFDLNEEESYRNGAYSSARANPRAYDSFGRAAAAGKTFGGYGYGNSNQGYGFEENTSMNGYQNNNQANQEEFAP